MTNVESAIKARSQITAIQFTESAIWRLIFKAKEEAAVIKHPDWVTTNVISSNFSAPLLEKHLRAVRHHIVVGVDTESV